jgi:5-methylcytosine-specific restriction endonuclease McrA
MLVAQKYLCANPNCRWTIDDNFVLDHIIPLARGGGHTIDNIQFLCPPCNLSKGYLFDYPQRYIDPNRKHVTYLEKTPEDQALLDRLREDGTWPDWE